MLWTCVYYTHNYTALCCCQASFIMYWNGWLFECVRNNVCISSTVEKSTHPLHIQRHTHTCLCMQMCTVYVNTHTLFIQPHTNTTPTTIHSLTHTYTCIPTESEEKQVFSVARSNKQQKELSRKFLYSKIVCWVYDFFFFSYVSRSVCKPEKNIKNQNNTKIQQQQQHKKKQINGKQYIPILFVKMAAIKWTYISKSITKSILLQSHQILLFFILLFLFSTSSQSVSQTHMCICNFF